jgi:nicotinate-nucleotide adenylyltransferase
MKVGIFGGTFNPPHNTHIEIAHRAVAALGLDVLYVLPSGQPPHKCAISKLDRLILTRLAFAEIDKAVVDDFEINKAGYSYSLDTLEEFSRRHPSDQLFFIIGRDSLQNFPSWHRPEEIAKLCTLVVANRNDEDGIAELISQRALQYSANIIPLDIDQSDISSTEIRLMYQFGLDATKYVPAAVDEYIPQANLYSEYRELTKRVQQYISPERYSHTFYVTLKALQLNTSCDENKVFLASALHDVAKNIKPDEWQKYGYTNTENYPPPVVHAFLGAEVARQDFGVTDPEILDAIRFHTSAKPNMSPLAMLIYIADKTEKSRDYPTQHLFKPTLMETFFEVLVEAEHFRQLKDPNAASVCPLTQEAIDFYTHKLHN